LLFNGKAGFGINTMDFVTVKHNSFYQNARIVENASELVLQSSTPASVSDNLFSPRVDRTSIKDSSGLYTNVLANATMGSSLDTNLPASVQRLEAVFQNPEQLDFRAANGVGRRLV
jgi:hypothetical protein